MTFPALDAFADDDDACHSTWKVYMRLQRGWLNHHTPRDVKVRGLADAWRMGDATIISALNFLIERGYLIEHGRGVRGVRRLTLAWSVPSSTVSQSTAIHPLR